MIKSWANSETQQFAEGGKCTLSGLDQKVAMELLAVLDAAASLQDLSPLKSVGMHKHKGDRRGRWAMTVNGPWRVCFSFRDGDARNVEIVDYP